VLLPQPVTDHVRHCLLLHHAFGCEMHLAASVPAVAATAVRRLARGMAAGEPLAIIPTGGTSALGAIGYVNAACELADQIRAGLLPEPKAIFVPVGTAGTAAGLLLGLRLAGLRSAVVGVMVTDILPPSARRIAALARGAARRLRRVAPSLPATPIAANDIVIERAYLGAGYGAVSEAGVAAQRLLADAEGITLETTYTGKTMAAMLDLAARPPYRDEPLLFWHTYSSVDPGAALPQLPDWRELPPAFHRFFT
jgi:D-cysteine desulfhydrase